MPSTPTRLELALTLALLSLSGCHDRLYPPIGSVRDVPPQRGGTLTLATFVHVRSIDPAVAFDEGSEPIVRLIFARLFRISRDGSFEGDLVRAYHFSPDGLELRLELRQDARFQDGTPVSAQDVKRSLQRALHPDTPCPVPSFYDRIVGYDAFRKGEAQELTGIVVVSEHHLNLRLREPDTTFPAVLTLPVASPVCPSAGDSYNPAFSLHACGAGPFRLSRWDGQEALHLQRFDAYHEAGQVHLNGIRLLFGVQTASQRFRFEQGDIDIAHELSAADSVAFRADPSWQPFGAWNRPRSTRGFFMNATQPPFDRVEVRRAAASAIDRNAVASLRAGHLVPANQMVPAGVVGHNPDFAGQRFDYARALQLMRDAGFAYDPATDTGGYPHPIDYIVPVESGDLHVAELFQQQLRRIGLRIRLKTMSWTASLAMVGRRGAAKMGGDGWSADFDHPSDFFDPIFSSAAIQNEESQNHAFFSNAELDSVLARARRELVPAQRSALYQRAEQIIRDQAPWAIVYGYRYYDVWQPYVRGFRPHPHAFLHVANVWLDQQVKTLSVRSGSAPPGSLNALAFDLRRSTPR
ncbi:MAG: ABC transporter substrate-binding protein [Polyangiaceae bacterium]|jgi:ABC-type transport system substrate-binding protein|nr:ABC transporter substrate-binding protein [Polyangiaceae bacterium]